MFKCPIFYTAQRRLLVLFFVYANLVSLLIIVLNWYVKWFVTTIKFSHSNCYFYFLHERSIYEYTIKQVFSSNDASKEKQIRWREVCSEVDKGKDSSMLSFPYPMIHQVFCYYYVVWLIGYAIWLCWLFQCLNVV
jgi:hypothetical protein